MTSIEPKQLHWLSGLLEAEGSFLKPSPSSPNTPKIQIMMTDEDIIARVSTLFGVKYHQVYPKKATKPTFACHLRGKRAVALMKLLYPLMSKRRQIQIDRALAGYKRKSKLSEDDVHVIKRRLNAGETCRAIAQDYPVSRAAISDIKCGRSWSNIEI